MDNSSALLAGTGIMMLVITVLGIMLIPVIFYLLTIQRTLEKCSVASRAMSPGMVWLMLLPLFGQIWHFFIVLNTAKSLAAEFNSRGIAVPEPEPGKGIGLAMCISSCCTIIPVLGALAGLAFLVLWIMYWIKIADYSKQLNLPVATTY